MAIIQEKRENEPRPEVKDTKYGVQYVTAATETPVVGKVKEERVKEAPVAVEAPVEQPVEVPVGHPMVTDAHVVEQVVAGAPVAEAPVVEETPSPAVRRAGRPRKKAKKD